MSDWGQPTLFETGPAHARGPVQSQLTLDSLGRDTTLKFRIALATVTLAEEMGMDGMTLEFTYTVPVTDDDITQWMEHRFGRRYQRNVIARTRGLMERDGWFTPVPDVIGRTGRKTHAIVPHQTTVRAIKLWLSDRVRRES